MNTNNAAANTLRVEHSEQSISIFRGNQSEPLIIQHAVTHKRPYIHPIAAPDGKGILTEDSPPHHPWQHGLYVGLNDINGVGFWEEGIRTGHDGSFHPKPMQPPILNNNQANWKVETDWLDPNGKHMITEGQEWTFVDHGNTYELDVIWTLKAEMDLKFGQYAYGGLFLRMPFKEELGGEAINSIGQRNQEAEASRAAWVAVHMPIDGRDDKAGIAIFDHKENSEYPVPWRVDNQLGVAPSRCINGAWELRKGQTETFKHRLYVYCGDTNVSEIQSSWNVFNGGANS
jgi:hypothetical protein